MTAASFAIPFTLLSLTLPIDRDLEEQHRECQERRASLAQLLAEESEKGVLLVPGAPSLATDAFRQADNTFYFTGLDVPSICAVITPADRRGRHEEALFISPWTESQSLWSGPRQGYSEQADEETGFQKVYRPQDFGREFKRLLGKREVVYYLDEPELERGTAENRVRQWLDRVPGGEDLDVVPFEHRANQLRMVKSAREIALLQKAVNATGLGIENGMRLIRPGTTENEIRGAIEGQFIRSGAGGVGFPSIVGSGPNTCVLHYPAGKRMLEDGDLCLMDVGARYGNYTADISRTVPVSGTFSRRQRQIYGIVVNAQSAAENAARPGASLQDLHRAASKVIRDGLKELGVLSSGRGGSASRGGVGRYFPHGTSHWIGIAVHDVGSGRLQPGTAFTIEPGIYLQDEGLGIRVEDDYVLTEDGALLCLSGQIPKTPDEIEEWMERLRTGEDDR